MSRKTRDPKDPNEPWDSQDPKDPQDPKEPAEPEPTDGIPKTEPSASTSAIRAVLLPLSRFYTRAQTRAGQELPPELTEEERATLRDAGEKFVAEATGILRTWRTEGDACPPQGPVRDPQTGRFPEPTLCFFSELLTAVGVVTPDPELAAQRQALELARLEAEVERERLATERARFEWMTAQLRAGNTKVVDTGPVERSQPMLLRAVGGQAEAAPPAQARAMAMTAAPSWSTQTRGAVRTGTAPATAAYAAAPATEAQAQASAPSLRERLIDCLRVAFCDFLLCVLDVFCVDGRFDFSAFRDPQKVARLAECLGVFLCTALRCMVDALCPPEPAACTPTQLDCNFAVEGVN